jgi:hypothetical protein
MRTVKFVIATDLYAVSQTVSLSDQAATNAIASGAAVAADGATPTPVAAAPAPRVVVPAPAPIVPRAVVRESHDE